MLGAGYPKLQGVSAGTAPERVVELLRQKDKRCAAGEEEQRAASGMLRAAFWVVAGYWLPAAIDQPLAAPDRAATAEASRWGFALDAKGRTRHSEALSAAGTAVDVRYTL